MNCNFRKDPAAVVDYEIDWTATLNATSPVDTISTSTWTINGGVAIDSTSNTTLISTVWVSGGTLGHTADLTNKIVTANGRTLYKTLYVFIASK